MTDGFSNTDLPIFKVCLQTERIMYPTLVILVLLLCIYMVFRGLLKGAFVKLLDSMISDGITCICPLCYLIIKLGRFRRFLNNLNLCLIDFHYITRKIPLY